MEITEGICHERKRKRSNPITEKIEKRKREGEFREKKETAMTERRRKEA